MKKIFFGIIEIIKNLLYILGFVILVIIIYFLITYHFRPDCKNTNPIFDKYPYTDKEYKMELAKQLKLTDSTKCYYYVRKYLEKNNRQYLVVDIVGGNICTKGLFDMTDIFKEGHFQQFQNNKGNGWGGAELDGFKYKIDITADTINFVAMSLKRFID